MSVASYPKIYNLGHAAIKDLFLDSVLVEEKVDGSQFSFGRYNGELKCRSRGCQIILDNAGMFQAGVDAVKELDLIDGWTYRGEYLAKPKHNTLAYNRHPRKHVILFDINTGLETYMAYREKAEEADRIGLEIVPILYSGEIKEAEFVKKFLTEESILGGQKIEGVVIKNYSRFAPDGHVLMGKYVSESFKEIHKVQWKESNPNKNDILFFLVNQLKTPSRWDKAVQHLKERGEYTASPKDIGALIKEVQNDIKQECEEMIKEKLFGWAWNKIASGVVEGLPQWYKDELLKTQF